jgi:hypothetical protein
MDHVDPATKEHHSIWSWRKDRREIELAKCQVLCFECHKQKSANECRERLKGKPNTWQRLLTPMQVRVIRESGLSNSKIAKVFGIGRTTVCNVRTRLSYAEIS